jgi:hypothetical protein
MAIYETSFDGVEWIYLAQGRHRFWAKDGNGARFNLKGWKCFEYANEHCFSITALRTASLTFNNSTFCPHSVFMCFVWISEQTAIISLYSINCLSFITETECVYCAVRAEYLNISVVRWLVACRRPGFHPSSVHMKVMLDRVALVCVFSVYCDFPLSSFHHLFILVFMHISLLPDRQVCEAREPPEKHCCFGNRGALDRKELPLFCL